VVLIVVDLVVADFVVAVAAVACGSRSLGVVAVVVREAAVPSSQRGELGDHCTPSRSPPRPRAARRGHHRRRRGRRHALGAGSTATTAPPAARAVTATSRAHLEPGIGAGLARHLVQRGDLELGAHEVRDHRHLVQLGEVTTAAAAIGDHHELGAGRARHAARGH
jgi:hypothetical protein